MNLLLTEREGRNGEYWPEVVAVRTERSEVLTKTTEGQYIENNTWTRGDMEFIFECSHRYRTSERSERVRYRM